MKITKLIAVMAILFMLFSKANAQTPLPQASFVMDTNQICQGGSINFTNTSTGNIVSQTWTFNGSQTYNWFEPGNPPAIFYQNWSNGGFRVWLEVVDADGYTSAFEKYITVRPSPVLESVFPQQDVICDGDSALFTIETNASSPSFQWRTYNGTFDTITTTSSLLLGDEGNYQVFVIDEWGCKSQSAGIYVEVHEPITISWNGDFPNISSGEDTVEVCERDYPTWLYVNATNIYGYNQSMFTWQNGQNGSSIQTDSTQLYIITVNDEANECGLKTDSLYLVVHTEPIPTIITTPEGHEFCEDDMVTLTTDTMYSDVQWTYMSPSNQFTAETEVFNLQTSGTYRLSVTDAFGCRGYAETPFIAINPRPAKPEIVVANGCALAASSAPTGTTYQYQWFLQNDSITDAIDQYFTTETAGFYTVQITFVENGCANLSDPMYASCDLSGIETVSGTQLVPYPNPFTESFVLPNTKLISATLVDMFGKVVDSKTSNTTITFDGSKVASGVYALVVQDEDIIQTIRVVKQ